MDNKKSKSILFIQGVFEGHVTSTIELVNDLISLGYNVSCYVLDQFAKRYENTDAKLIIYSIEKKDLYQNKNSFRDLLLFRCLDTILTQGKKEKEKYDYLLVDSLFDGKEINKIFKASAVISVHTLPHIQFPLDLIKQANKEVSNLVSILNKKFNLDFKDPLTIISNPNAKYKLVLTSRKFQSSLVCLDHSFYFIGPSFIEKKPIDKSFPFKKDLNKKLIYISLGTVFNNNTDFFKLCIKAFAFSKKFQLILSIGKSNDIKEFGKLPDNVYIYNFVPQQQILAEADIFISHGGLNSINERLILSKKPLIIIPQFGDQFSNAYQIALLGAGISLDKDKVNEDDLKNAVNSILDDGEKYKKRVEKILESFQNARNERKKILKKLLI